MLYSFAVIKMAFADFFKNEDDMWTRLADDDKPILLYGTGNGADKVLDEFNRLGISAAGVFVSDGFARGQSFRGYAVTDYSSACESFGDFTVVQAFGSGRREVIENTQRLSLKHTYYAADVPVYGDNIFNRAFVNDNIDKIEETYSLLADEKSRLIYENLIKYKFTGLRRYLTACECEKDDVFSLLSLTDGEIYLDLGAYTGDTAAEFISRCPGYSSIIACEPDIKTFKKLERNLSGTRGVRLVNACAAGFDGEILFNSGSGRGSSAGGGTPVKAMRVDTIVGNENVTYLKADVEGAELDMLRGMKNTILNSMPKLRIAAYHRSEDVFTVPLAVNKISDGYKIYITHTPHTLGWDTDFIFV